MEDKRTAHALDATHHSAESAEFHEYLEGLSPAYRSVVDFMRLSGKRIAPEAGRVADIGESRAKAYVTAEDLRIERELKALISQFPGNHTVYAEEENDVFAESDNVWVIDPISGTKTFIQGLPHYAIVVSHLHKGETVFTAVYDPSADDLYSAELKKGAFLNGQRIRVSKGGDKVIIRSTSHWRSLPEFQNIKESLASTHVVIEKDMDSLAVCYARVARGEVDGIISLTKDSFPEFSGALLVEEAGGTFTNGKGDSEISPDDRIFIGGNETMHGRLLPSVKNL